MKTIYKFTRKKDFQKWYTKEQIKNLEEYYKTSKPVDYFVHQIRYKDLITMSFKEKSEYSKTFDIVKNKLNIYFFTFKVEKKRNQYTVRLSFSDFIRFLLITEIRITFWIDSEILKKILLFLRYDVIKTTNKTPPKGDIMSYMMNKEVFALCYEKEYGKEKIKIRVKEIEKEINRLGINIVMNCHENDKFEKIIYYILHYNNPMFLLINFEWRNMYRIDYIQDRLSSQCFRKWIWFDLLYFMFPYTREYRDTLRNIVHKQIYDNMTDIQNKIKNKRDYINQLTEECDAISLEEIEKDDAHYKMVLWKIIKAELESDIWIYDIDNKLELISCELDDVIKDMQEFVSKAGNSELTVSFRDQKPMYMKGKFKTNDMDKYLELKDYTSDYGYVAHKNHKWSNKTIVWEKHFKYKKSWKPKKDV
jgi:hypothetical protein